jgi:triosephosphate isomerase
LEQIIIDAINSPIGVIDEKTFVAGNWKMNKTVEQASLWWLTFYPVCRLLTRSTVCSAAFSGADGPVANDRWHRNRIGSAENAREESGAFTGEVAPARSKNFALT